MDCVLFLELHICLKRLRNEGFAEQIKDMQGVGKLNLSSSSVGCVTVLTLELKDLEHEIWKVLCFHDEKIVLSALMGEFFM